jgi:hypothetical protein
LTRGKSGAASGFLVGTAEVCHADGYRGLEYPSGRAAVNQTGAPAAAASYSGRSGPLAMPNSVQVARFALVSARIARFRSIDASVL